MEENNRDFSGQGSREDQKHENQSAVGSQSDVGNPSTGSDPNNRNTTKFEQDNDDFHRSEDNMDNEMNVSGGFTGSSTSSDLSRDSSGAFTSDDMDTENRNAAATNDSEQSKTTNDEDDFLNTDWNSRDL